LLELPGATDLPAIKGKVELRQVSFFYELIRPVLQDSKLLTAQPGEVIALVARSGAGNRH
jgi:ATP-binding cassette subfamily B protein